MDKKIECPVVIGIAILFLALKCDVSLADTYIVHMSESESTLEDFDNFQYMESSLRSVSETATILYEYKNVLNGYSTILTDEEVESLKALPEVISVLPESRYEPHTTRSPAFLGLYQHEEILPSSQQLSDVIVGVLDSGIWPESKSFDDTGLGPIPCKWKGRCETGTNFTVSMCNRKLVGARFFIQGYEAAAGVKINYSEEYRSPRDSDGHGTHTASTAVGSAVSGASLFGNANGTARGMVPQARLAIYKCCWKHGCFKSDILAAMDKAIEDNVNVISISLGGKGSVPYYLDSFVIGAFAAMDKGIFVSCSAGNSGPGLATVTNVAPWITTVGAGTLDRDFPAQIKLGSKDIYYGTSFSYVNDSLGDKLIPLIYACNATNDTIQGCLCMPDTLISKMVRHKIVVCDRGINARVEKGFVVKAAGGAGMILANTITNGESVISDAHVLPAAAVGQNTGTKIKKYILSNLKPTANIFFLGTKLGVQPAPVVADFSSRGPNVITPEILKPDIIAPGVNILAGWTGDTGPSGLATDTRRVLYNIVSGTSMACPHVSGIAALLRAAHPDWSVAAIRSALMTTAYFTYKDEKPIIDGATGNASTPFAHGSGHVNPMSAFNPGLIYDLNKTDYLRYLCAICYTPEQIKIIARNTKFTCNEPMDSYSVSDLNYPSFAVSIQADPKGSITLVKHRRTLTNVGPSRTYNARIFSSSHSVNISVNPRRLTFRRTNEKKSYMLTFAVNPKMQANTSQFGRIVWYCGKDHVVGSPFSVSWTS